jgi:cis-L-3-hydroxyproline dehydratase
MGLQRDDSFYPVLGHLVGRIAQDRIPVIDGLEATPSEDQLKAMGAASASAGAVALFHLVGVTPEAPTLEAALQGHTPQQDLDIGMVELRAAREELSTAWDESTDIRQPEKKLTAKAQPIGKYGRGLRREEKPVGSVLDDRDGKPSAAGQDDSSVLQPVDALDMVVLGSPHFSLAEFRALAPLVAGKQRHPAVQFLITSSRAMTALAERAGLLEPLRQFGVRLTVDTCILTTPMLPPEIKTLMTNSAKYAYYAPGLLNMRVVFGSLADCVQSALAGRVVRDDTLWNG